MRSWELKGYSSKTKRFYGILSLIIPSAINAVVITTAIKFTDAASRSVTK